MYSHYKLAALHSQVEPYLFKRLSISLFLKTRQVEPYLEHPNSQQLFFSKNPKNHIFEDFPKTTNLPSRAVPFSYGYSLAIFTVFFLNPIRVRPYL